MRTGALTILLLGLTLTAAASIAASTTDAARLLPQPGDMPGWTVTIPPQVMSPKGTWDSNAQILKQKGGDETAAIAGYAHGGARFICAVFIFRTPAGAHAALHYLALKVQRSGIQRNVRLTSESIGEESVLYRTTLVMQGLRLPAEYYTYWRYKNLIGLVDAGGIRQRDVVRVAGVQEKRMEAAVR